jgi:hypothetical protein
MEDQPVTRMLSTLNNTSMPPVGFKITTPVFKLGKTFWASVCKATVMKILVTIITGCYLSLCFQEFLLSFTFTCMKLLITDVLCINIPQKQSCSSQLTGIVNYDVSVQHHNA